jgi:hypothetical protein
MSYATVEIIFISFQDAHLIQAEPHSRSHFGSNFFQKYKILSTVLYFMFPP